MAAPPGLALCLFSKRAIARRLSRASIPAYYADINRWLPVMDDPGRYYSTPSVNEIVALGEALRIVHEEGLPARFARHRRTASAMRVGLQALGFQDRPPALRADTLSVVLLPKGLADAAFRRETAARGVVLAGALGPIAGRAFRLGHMGKHRRGRGGGRTRGDRGEPARARPGAGPGHGGLGGRAALRGNRERDGLELRRTRLPKHFSRAPRRRPPSPRCEPS